MECGLSIEPFAGAKLTLYLSGGGQRAFSLSDTQLAAVIKLLGLSLHRDDLAGYDDWTILEQIKGMDDLAESWR